jgi:hypothetical protein
MLYTARKKSRSDEIDYGNAYDISKDIPLMANRMPDPTNKSYFRPDLMPVSTISESGMKKWFCTPVLGDQM